MDAITAVILGGTSGLGRQVAEHLAARGERVVIAGRDAARARNVATEIGSDTIGIAVDLGAPYAMHGALESVERVDHLVIAGADVSLGNTVQNYNVDDAIALATVKLVGYTQAIHVLRPRLVPSASLVLFGGFPYLRPFPGSTMLTTVNAGVSGLTKTLASELAPIRVNAIHPGVVGDSPRWKGRDTSGFVQRTTIGRLVTMAEVADAVLFLLDNGAVSGIDLCVDGGMLVR